MSKMNMLLSERLKNKLSKMTELAELSADGNLSSFSGIFRTVPLSLSEREQLAELLRSHGSDGQEIETDLAALSNLTSEVKAITNQAAILHGERIKRAQEILKKYRDGAFSAWLIAAYGNRQTPYNFLQYYEFYRAISQSLRPKLDTMPRQAIYTLASRPAPLKQKEEIIHNYKGEGKNEVLALIRKTFPLDADDKRAPDLATQALAQLKTLKTLLSQNRFRPRPEQKEALLKILQGLIKDLDG